MDDPAEALVPFARGKALTFNFCRRCGNLVSWRSLTQEENGRIRIAANLRLAEPEDPLLRFDVLHTFEDIDPMRRSVKDVWF